jgi:hypothetical protein
MMYDPKINKSDSIELLKGFQQGFSLNYQGLRLPTDANNLPSARKYPYILQGKLPFKSSIESDLFG